MNKQEAIEKYLGKEVYVDLDYEKIKVRIVGYDSDDSNYLIALLPRIYDTEGWRFDRGNYEEFLLEYADKERRYYYCDPSNLSEISDLKESYVIMTTDNKFVSKTLNGAEKIENIFIKENFIFDTFEEAETVQFNCEFQETRIIRINLDNLEEYLNARDDCDVKLKIFFHNTGEVV